MGEPTFEQFMYLYSILKQQGNFGWVEANCRKAKEMGYFISWMPSTQKSWRNRWCLAYGDWECPLGKTVTKDIPTHFQSIGSMKWGPISKGKEDEVERVRLLLSETELEYRNLVTQENLLESGLLQGMAGVVKGSTKVVVDIDEHPRGDDEGLVTDALAAKKKALEEAHQSVMGTRLSLPHFYLQASPKLPFGMKDVFAEGVEMVDFGKLCRQKKEVNLAMHRQKGLGCLLIIVLEVISIPRMRQSLAFGITKLISAGAADFGNIIWTFPCRSQGTFSRVFGGQGNLVHDPVPDLERTGFDSEVIVLGDPLFVSDVAHVGLVTELVDEVEPSSIGATASVPKEIEKGGLQSLLNDLVYGFNLAIGLRMGCGSETKTYL
ncbi:unnamed protein product [Prunus armeniaca]